MTELPSLSDLLYDTPHNDTDGVIERMSLVVQVLLALQPVSIQTAVVQMLREEARQ